jgi:magnesium-transporting ATPase (P-type)
MSSGNYEFTSQQNDMIGSLAGKMKFVGLFALVFGVLYLLSAVLVLAAIFQDKLPADVVKNVPDEVKKSLPNTQFLWGICIQSAVGGLIFTFIGVWTRSAGDSFKMIVDTTGRDISHLMNALGSLHKMYSLLSTLITIALLAFLIGLGLQLYLKYAG